MWLSNCRQSQCLPRLSPCPSYSQSNRARSWPCSLEWAEVKCKYANGKAVCDFMCVGLRQCSPYLSPCAWCSQSKCAMLWPRPSELADIKCKHANRKTICNLMSWQCQYLSYHRLRDNHLWASQFARFESDLEYEGKVRWRFGWKSPGERTTSTMHLYAEIDASRSGRLFAVENRTFRDRRTHARTDILSAMITPFHAPLERCNDACAEEV